VLVCGETDASLALSARRIALLTSAPMLAVRTKADLVTKRDEIASVATDIPFAGPVAVSAVTGVGLAALLAHTARLLAEHHGTPDAELPMLTRARHREGLERAREEMAAFAAAWRAGELPAPVAAVHLRSASAALESLIGAIDVDDVLDRLFATFCIGK
jgi:tRNA modification GTPase